MYVNRGPANATGYELLDALPANVMECKLPTFSIKMLDLFRWRTWQGMYTTMHILYPLYSVSFSMNVNVSTLYSTRLGPDQLLRAADPLRRILLRHADRKLVRWSMECDPRNNPHPSDIPDIRCGITNHY